MSRTETLAERPAEKLKRGELAKEAVLTVLARSHAKSGLVSFFRCRKNSWRDK